MMASGKVIKVFYSYAHEDKKLRDELEKHLSALRRMGQIKEWHDHEINAGTDWKREIDIHLSTANIILLLISPDFLHSEYCYQVEMKQALERHAIGAACVLPIILRPVDWENTPFSAIQILPSGGKPVTLWPDLDEALRDVARGVKKVVDELSTQKLSDVSLVKQANLKHRRNTSTIFQDKETQRRYLRRTLLETEKLILKGIPAGLIAQSVRLDEVFISLEFRPNRPVTDYPLTKNELQEYHQLVKDGSLPEAIERVLFEAEKAWHRSFKEQEKIDIKALGKRLTREQPTAVIQAFPGMGKSTLLTRLTLHMARQCLHQSDETMPEILSPPLIPIFLALGAYAVEREKVPTLSLTDYLLLSLSRFNITNLVAFILSCLENGCCLVLLDGLDEVSDQQMRVQIQEEIRAFIFEYRNTPEARKDFNRFLITSRVAGYDQGAFPDYLHYTIAELTEEQIEHFIFRWYRANAYRDHDFATIDQEDKKDAIAQEARKMANDLIVAIRDQRAIRDLAGNPLLLTLLAVMQQNSIELPRQRVELYRVITFTLLENRNIAKGLPIIPEVQAVQRLGPLAFEMQSTGNSFTRRDEVMASLEQTIRSEGGTDEEIAREAEIFLNRIRERAGLFVLRTGDYFGFFHRTFQEYFVARYMLNEIKRDPVKGIQDLVNKARQSDELWREPFLLAVAYKSNEDETTAGQIIRALLGTPKEVGAKAYADGKKKANEHNLLLAFECLMEAKPFTIEPALEREIATRLLQSYTRDGVSMQEIEKVLLRWLQSLPKEAYRPTLLTFLRETIVNSQQVDLQRATLTLLVMIAERLAACPLVVFNTLIPPLLALAGLPAVGGYQPATDLEMTPDLVVTDLAVAVLAFMGKQGPAGLLLSEVHQYFVSHPEQLKLLAHYSMKYRILLTPAPSPQLEEKKRQYKSAIERWRELAKRGTTHHITKEEIDESLAIHQTLLGSAEEVYYPGAIYLLDMLQMIESRPDQSWQQTYEDYLAGQLSSGTYTSYQDAAILWIFLLSEQQSLQRLATLLIEHYVGSETTRERYAKQLVTTLISDLSEIRYKNEQDEMERAIGWGRPYIAKMRFSGNRQMIRYLSRLGDLKAMGLLNHRYIIGTKINVEDLEGMFDLLEAPQLQALRDLLLSHEYIEKFIQYLDQVGTDTPTAPTDRLNLFNILLERLYCIKNTKENSKSIIHEMQRIAFAAYNGLAHLAKNDNEASIRLRIISSLPTRSVEETKLVLQLAKETTDKRIQEACAAALKQAVPQTVEEIKLILQLAKETTDKKIQESYATALKRAIPQTLEMRVILLTALEEFSKEDK